MSQTVVGNLGRQCPILSSERECSSTSLSTTKQRTATATCTRIWSLCGPTAAVAHQAGLVGFARGTLNQSFRRLWGHKVKRRQRGNLLW